MLFSVSTSFKFDSIDIQLHDTYFVLGPLNAIIFLFLVLLIGRYFFQLILFLIDRSKPFALFVAIAIPVIIYFIVAYIYLMLTLITALAGRLSEIPPLQEAGFVYIPCLILILALVAVEVMAMRKIASRKQ